MFGPIPSAIGGGGQDDGVELQFVAQRVGMAVGMSGSLVWHGEGVLYGKWHGMADVMAWHCGFWHGSWRGSWQLAWNGMYTGYALA